MELAYISAETKSHQLRMKTLKRFFVEDVLKLYEAYADNDGASAVCGDILRIIHTKEGDVDPTEMFRLDFENKAAALRLIELAASPFELSDEGLAEVLTDEQLAHLLAEKRGELTKKDYEHAAHIFMTLYERGDLTDEGNNALAGFVGEIEGTMTMPRIFNKASEDEIKLMLTICKGWQKYGVPKAFANERNRRANLYT